MIFNVEQDEILNLVDTMLKEHSGYGWGHFQGDVVPRILTDFANKHLPINMKIVGPNVYIKDISTEFDLMVVDSNAYPIHFTSSYSPEHIICIIEVKRQGIIGNIDNFKKSADKIKGNFDKAVSEANCRAAYITVSETVNPSRKTSNQYWKITKQHLSPYQAFVLRDSRNNETQYGEWRHFIEYITSERVS